MADKKFELGDYIEVKDRIRIFYELYPGGRLVTHDVRWPREGDDVPRISVEAYAYRTPDDPLPGVGWSWMVLPGTTPYTRGSELENTETSAWGRAIASLGILIDRSIASAQEVANKDGQTDTKPPYVEPVEVLLGDASRTGKMVKGTAPCDLQWREGPDGHAIGFTLRIADDKNIPQVILKGDVGEAVYIATSGDVAALKNQSARVWGRLFELHKSGQDTSYRLYVTHIKTDDLEYPAEAESLPLPLEASGA